MEGTKNTNENLKQEIETQNDKVESYRASLYEARSIFRQLFGEYPEGYKSKLGEGARVKKFLFQNLHKSNRCRKLY